MEIQEENHGYGKPGVVFSPHYGGKMEFRGIIFPPFCGPWGENRGLFSSHILDPGGKIGCSFPPLGCIFPHYGGNKLTRFEDIAYLNDSDYFKIVDFHRINKVGIVKIFRLRRANFQGSNLYM